MVVAVGVPVVIGGDGLDGRALASLEAMVPASILGGPAFVSIASLRFPRATALYSMVVARRGHTATLLADGRVLILGGLDCAGQPLDVSGHVGREGEAALAFGRIEPHRGLEFG